MKNKEERAKLLQDYIDEILNLEERKRELGVNIKEIYESVAKRDFDPAILKILIKNRKIAKEEREYQQSMLEQYEQLLNDEN